MVADHAGTDLKDAKMCGDGPDDAMDQGATDLDFSAVVETIRG